ncbi:MAG: Maf family protein [Bradymonadales bacterium]|jgi:septum formation protein
MQIILASASPRRKELLESLGLELKIRTPNIDEFRAHGESGSDYVLRMSREKAFAVLEQCPRPLSMPLLAADTTVVCGGEILEKPVDRADAARMLGLLRDREHYVYTGVCIIFANSEEIQNFVVESKVVFGQYSEHAIQTYIDSGEADDKAGAYGIQGKAAVFVKSVEGSYTNIVGLPLFECARALSII